MTNTQDKTYNGWTNYETWLLKLWIDNEQSTIEFYYEEARSRLDLPEDQRIMSFADSMKDDFETQASELVGVTGFWQDLISASLSEVNWQEIAEHIFEEIK